MNARHPTLALLLLAGAAALAPESAVAQAVEGVVVDPAAGRPLAGAELRLLGPDGRAVASEISDSYGRFHLTAPAPGAWRVAGTLIGYGAARSELLELREGRTVTVEIRMSVDPVALEEPVVVLGRTGDMEGDIGGFHHRRRHGEKTGLGRYIYGAQLEHASGPPTRLLQAIPGVSFSRGGGGHGEVIHMRGGCIPAVYIDGSQINGFDRRESLDTYLNAQTIQGIEVYRGVQQPGGRFHDPNGCGLVLVWTHRGRYAEGGSIGWTRLVLGLGLLVALFALR